MGAFISIGLLSGLLQTALLVLVSYWLMGSAIEIYGRELSWPSSVVVFLRISVLAALAAAGLFAWPWFMQAAGYLK